MYDLMSMHDLDTNGEHMYDLMSMSLEFTSV
jgi:hypothetical protein